MGNVLASAPLHQPPPPFRTGDDENTSTSRSDAPAPTPPGQEQSQFQFARNPGTVEDLHKKCKELFPMPFEGARIIINKGLSEHFQISHTINMSSVTPPGYRFGATYVGTKRVSASEAYPVLLGDIDPSGNVSSHIIHAFNERVRGKIVSQFSEGKLAGCQIGSDYKGDNFTASGLLVNADILTGTGLGVFQYLQNVSPNLDVGAEVVYQRGPAVPNGGMAVVSLVGRYKSLDNWILSGTLNTSRANVCYYHKGLNDVINFGVEVETDLRMRESTATFGYSYDIPKANATLKASLDTNWAVGAVLEKRLLPLPFTLMLSGHALHAKQPQYKFGIGLMVG